MHTNNDIKTFLYKYIKEQSLYSEIKNKGGELYKNQRPTNSTVDDCVVSVHTMLNGDYGKAIVYVNIYVQDIKRNNEYVEDTITTALFEQEITKAFDNFKCCTDIYRVRLDSILIFKINGRNEHCVNAELSINIVNY